MGAAGPATTSRCASRSRSAPQSRTGWSRPVSRATSATTRSRSACSSAIPRAACSRRSPTPRETIRAGNGSVGRDRAEVVALQPDLLGRFCDPVDRLVLRDLGVEPRDRLRVVGSGGFPEGIVIENVSVVPDSPLSTKSSVKPTLSLLSTPVPVTVALDPEQVNDASPVEWKSVFASLYATLPLGGTVACALTLNLPSVVARVPPPDTLQPAKAVPPPPVPDPSKKSIAGA